MHIDNGANKIKSTIFEVFIQWVFVEYTKDTTHQSIVHQ